MKDLFREIYEELFQEYLKWGMSNDEASTLANETAYIKLVPRYGEIVDQCYTVPV